MSQENTDNQVQDQNIQTQAEAPVQKTEDLDNSLDLALSKVFGNNTSEEPKKETSDEKPKQMEASKEDPSKEAKSEDKKNVSNAKLPNPDSVGEMPPGKKVSSESKQGWDTLRNNYRAAHKMVEDRDKEIASLKTSLAEKSTNTGKEVEELKKQIEELNKYRAMVDVQADPEFISKYDEPINQRKQDIKDLLLPHNVSEQTIDSIDYSDSKVISEIASIIRKERGDVDADDFLSSARDLRSLLNKRDKASKDYGDNYKTYLENKKKESFSKQAEEEGRMARHIEKTTKEKAIPFLTKKEVSDGASKGEIDQAKAHNDLVDIMTSKVNEVLKMNSPEDKAEIAIAAIASHWLNAQNKQLQAKIASLESELKKISTVNSETEKPRSSPRKNDNNLDLDSAMSNFFANK